MTKTIKAGIAAVKVLENWGVKNIYGLPGGSINSLLDGLLAEKDNIHFVQVRHEEVGAMSASMHAKFTGHIGVAFGSAGPGGTHLLNGLYDAREDHVPVLAIIGQFGTTGMNMDTFQEMNEDPIYADVSVYHRVIMTAEQIPYVFDEAIRQAYSKRGVAVVQLPVNLGWEDIDAEAWFDASSHYKTPQLADPDEASIDEAIKILKEAKKPMIFSGIGMRGGGDELISLSRKLKAPIMISAPAIDTIDHDYEGFLGSWGRVARKPAVDANAEADTILMLGSNQPFINVYGMFDGKRVIQVDVDPAKLGKRQRTELSILADAKKVVKALNEKLPEIPATSWWNANLKNIANWKAYTDQLEQSTDEKLTLYQVYNKINEIADPDAVFSIDVGDVTMTSVRHLRLGKGQLWRTSALFATMGVGVPGAITAKLDFPNRQVFSLSGDGGFSMVMQDLATQVQEKLPILNIVFSNEQFGFIKDEQEETNQGFLGIEFSGMDFAKIGEAMGAKGYTVTRYSELAEVFEKAQADIKAGFTVLIDAKIDNESPIPVLGMQLDPEQYSADEIVAFKKRYQAELLEPFSTYLREEGLK